MLQNGNYEAILGRIPSYINFLETYHDFNISATHMASELNYGEVMVRKDLAKISGQGRPKTGYNVVNLLTDLKTYMGYDHKTQAVIVGMGKLGEALYYYRGFDHFNIKLIAAFDINNQYYHIDQLETICRTNKVDIGIITVPKEQAQKVCDLMIKNRIQAIWNFSPIVLEVPKHIIVQNENMANSLAILTKLLSNRGTSL